MRHRGLTSEVVAYDTIDTTDLPKNASPLLARGTAALLAAVVLSLALAMFV